MPELPEVETMCRGIARIRNRKILKVSKPRCRFRPIAMQPSITTINRKLTGQTISQISRLGKRVLIHAADQVLILQPKMTGLVSLELPPDPDHVRLQLDFVGRPPLRLQFWDRRGLGTVELISAADIHQRLVQGRLGPDALQISVEDFIQRLGSTRRAIKVALLDQKLLAGVGNLYASEMLHTARIHPGQLGVEISRAKYRKLHAAMQQILLEAIKYEGSTLADGTYRNALNDPGSYQNQHLVYDRAGQQCPTCTRAKIVRIVQAQRSSFFCPRCQKQKEV